MKDPKKDLISKVLYFRKQRQSGFKKSSRSQSDPKLKEGLRKGTEFESYVVRKFDEEYFTLIEWRSDKNVEGIFPLMSKFPDLEFYFESKTENLFFAIECKWRESFAKEKILLDQFQLENYRDYQRVTKNPTFLVLGIGNLPSNPNQVYIIPIDQIESEVLHEFNLGVYKRHDPMNNFFLDCRFRLLR